MELIQSLGAPIIWISGLPGSGKSTIGSHLAISLGGTHIDSDGESDHGANFRQLWGDSILVQHHMLSQALKIRHQDNKTTILSSLLSLNHPSVILIRLECNEEIRTKRKPDYYNKLKSGYWHKMENRQSKSIDTFSNISHYHATIDTSQALDKCISPIVDVLKSLHLISFTDKKHR